MKLLTFATRQNAATRLGAYLGDNTVVDLAGAYHQYFDGHAPDWFDSVSHLLRGGDKAMDLAQEVHGRLKSGRDDDRRSIYHDADKIVFGPPAGYRAKILCVSMNYASHAHAGASRPSQAPYFFIKMPNLMTPHGAPILHSKTSNKCDSEIELGVVIGRKGKYIAREDAFNYVAGYTVMNDFSFRDRRTIADDPNSARLHWLTLKNLDTAAPIGPWLVTKDEIPDPYDLEITLTLDNDPDQKQSGSTSGMLHRIDDLIYHASNGLTLEPGDVIATGTPHEVGFGRQRFLKTGDVVRAEIARIGALVNPIETEE